MNQRLERKVKMKKYTNFKRLISVVAVITLFFSSFSAFVVEATDGYENNTSSYNCYAYAINRVDECDINGNRFYNPAQTGRIYQPGDISEDIYNNFDVDFYGYDLNKVKCNVIKDLYAMGYTDVLIYSNVEDYNAYNSMLADIDFSTQELICLRVGTTDYHFMRYDSATNAWYNKNGDNPIYKYTNNNGIPSNDVPWVSGSNVYDSEIIYLVYNKLQISIPENGELEQNITVKGGVDEGLNYNPIYCCGDDACCNPDGVCSCENEIVYGGKDVVYEIVVPESGCYNISLSGGISSGFNYKIYSYNMYNGDYRILSEDRTTINVNVNLYFTIGENVSDRYYLIVDYNKENTFDVSIDVSALRQHTYTHSYESISDTEHKAFCQCGDSVTQAHTISGNFCTLCNQAHTHLYTDHYGQTSDSSHEAYCWCGEHISRSHSLEYYMHNGLQHKVACYCGYTYYEPHVFPISASHKICLRCGQMAGSGGILLEAHGEIIYLTESGSYLRPDGIVMLSDVDVELYLAGKLDINALIRQATNPAV